MDKEKINVLMAINRGYLKQMQTVICSLGRNCSCIVDIYVMHKELTENDIIGLRELVKKMCNGNLYEIRINTNFLKDAKVLSHFSVEMYYRIFATEFLPISLQRILWLDADVVVLKDLKDLFYTDLQGKSIAACGHRERLDTNPEMNTTGVNRLGLNENDVYFNSGVLLMDLDKIRRNFNRQEVLKLIYEKERVLINPDQDVLNLMYQNDKVILDWRKYNFQVHFDWAYSDEKECLRKTAAILHYVGPFKPWVYTSSHFTYQYYWKYYFLHSGKYAYLKNEFMKNMFKIYMLLKKKEN